jgi:hypothetical protein
MITRQHRKSDTRLLHNGGEPFIAVTPVSDAEPDGGVLTAAPPGGQASLPTPHPGDRSQGNP